MKVLIRSVGCKVNLADAASVVECLDADRCTIVDRASRADVALLNTCTVTHKADRDVRKILGAWMRDHPRLPVVVTGCGVKTQASRFGAFRNVRAIVPPGDPVAAASAVRGSPQPTRRRQGEPGSSFARMSRNRAFLKVQDGCNAHCSYCIVPSVRGAEWSLPLDEAVRRAHQLTDFDHRELVLCGIHLGRYGRTLQPPTDLAGLIQALATALDECGSEVRLRLSSIEPLEWTDGLIEAVARHSAVCEHFHVPLQSGADSVLRRMGRPYRLDQFRSVVEKLAGRLPGAALGTDILTGFPGESAEEAVHTLECVRSLPIAYLHVFTYSPRPGTPAAKMTGQVDPSIARNRAAALRALGNQHWRNFLAEGVGRSHQVLLEKHTPQGPVGRTRNYLPVRVEQTRSQPGQMLEVIARRVDGGTLVCAERDLSP
jgi:threonylcarbamoyladenosine tRNA methylthiotransferase MtaB